jgi:hypothetical protein
MKVWIWIQQNIYLETDKNVNNIYITTTLKATSSRLHGINAWTENTINPNENATFLIYNYIET